MTEIYEIALSDDGFVFGPFVAFEPGDVLDLAPFVKFRVTLYGDFDTDDYRQRGFAGISDDATLVEGGFGLSPFGRFPFGDGGVCLDDGNTSLMSGALSMSGALVADQTGFFGEVALSGSLLAVVLSNPVFLDGDLSMSGALNVRVSHTASGSISMSGTLSAVREESEAGSLSMSGDLQAVLQGSHLQLLSNVGRNSVPFRGAGTQPGESAIRGTIFRNSRE